MSRGKPVDGPPIAAAIPPEWRSFLDSGRYAGARAAIRVDGSEVPVELTARVEFLDERRMAIELALAEGRPALGVDSAGSAATQLLTVRERAVVALIASGRETPAIARALGVSPATVRTHVRNAMAKLGARTRAQLVAVAMASADGHVLPDAA
jgi:DNA-binding CsgD family transcriptional regulator